MTLSQIIKLRTDNGRAIADFLVDVMQDRFSDFSICHRLQAARLLTTYGNEDAPNFIADNTSDTPTARRNGSRATRQTKFDTELARVIREDTEDGRSIARFLVNVMEGELRTFKPHNRISAARELLNRGFGKSARTSTLRRSGEGRNPESASSTVMPQPVEGPARTPQSVHPEPVEGPTPNRRSGEGTACPVLDTGSPRTTIRGRNPESASSTVIPQPVEGPNPDAAHPLTPHSSPLTPQREAPPLTPHSSPLTPQREAPPLTPHSSPLTPQREAPPLTPGETAGLATDLLDNLTHIPPSSFEHTVLDLLENMGYGRARHIGRSGDGGIDGIIDQDTLGLDSVYVQAKRWTSQVGEPEIRSFSGSLDPHGATRGILITTSGFSERARRTAEAISTGSKHIRLVDGRELTQLMIDHSVGVTTDTPHHARKNVTPYSDTGLDENYFNQHT